jgi:hypothetical protein
LQPTRRQLGSGRRARAQQSALGGKKGNRTSVPLLSSAAAMGSEERDMTNASAMTIM